MKRIKPGPNQESVWDYPRPPALEDVDKHLKVTFNGEVIAETVRAKRVLETSQPPAYYFPPEDVNEDFIEKLKEFNYCCLLYTYPITRYLSTYSMHYKS